MDLNEVAVFIKVVQAGSFSNAAKALEMPKSTVSHKVSSLEKRLGITLIQRTTRQLNITPAGQAYFKKCIQSLQGIEAAEMEIAATQGEPQGLLRITAPVELGSSVLPDIIYQFTQKNRKVSVELILTDRRVDLLGENVDLAIRAGNLKDSTLIAKKIGTVYFAALASPKYLKAKGSPHNPKDLAEHDCVQFTSIGTSEWQLTGPKGNTKITMTGRILVNELNTTKRLTVAGAGIALLPTHICYPEVKSGSLVRVLPQWRTALSPVHFVYPAQEFVSPKLSAFMEMATPGLKKIFEDFAF